MSEVPSTASDISPGEQGQGSEVCQDLLSEAACMDGATDVQTSSTTELDHVLGVLQHARELIIADLERGPLPQSFFCMPCCLVPLTALSQRGFHGRCDIKVEGYEDEPDGVRRATAFTVRSIGLQLHDERGALLPVELLLATFIHELAHTVTRPEMRRCAEVANSVMKLQPQATQGTNGFVAVHHSETFYANFAGLLRVAERLGIYALPALPNKFAPKALMRFDTLDMKASLSGLNLGVSRLFATALGAPTRPLQVLLTDSAGVKRKPLALANRCIADVLSQAKQLLNLRKRPTAVKDSAGRPVDDSRMLSLEDGALLVVS